MSRIEIFLNEAGDRAVAYVPGKKSRFWLLERRDGRWYMTVDPQETIGMALAAVVFTANLKTWKQALTAIHESESPEELRERVRAIREQLDLVESPSADGNP